jgi:hypothetical protein
LPRPPSASIPPCHRPQRLFSNSRICIPLHSTTNFPHAPSLILQKRRYIMYLRALQYI